jgi:transcription-repair coupling factor (superfamily II helicase)
MASAHWQSLPWVKNNKDKISWGQLAGSGLSLAVSSSIAKQNAMTVIVTPDTPSALRLETELDYLLTEHKVMTFPDWETLPYDHFSPHQDIISQRLETLNLLKQEKNSVLIIPVSTLMLRTAPPSFIYGQALKFKCGDTVDAQQLKDSLTASGYRHVQQVMEHGEFAVRGSIVDLYPMGSKHPFRIDFFDDEIDSIRLFDIETQRSSDTVKEIDLLPAHEFPTNPEDIERFRIAYRAEFGASAEQDSIYMQVSKGNWPAGIEYYLPLFFDSLSTIFDYLPENTTIMQLADIEHAAKGFWQDVEKRYENRRVDPLRPLLAPAKLYLPVETLYQHFNQFARLNLSQASLPTKAGNTNLDANAIEDIRIDHKKTNPYESILQFVATQKKTKSPSTI